MDIFTHPSCDAANLLRDTSHPNQEIIQHFSELFRLDQPGWTFPGWGCGSFGKKTADMPEDVVDCGGVSIGASLKPVQSIIHSRLVGQKVVP